MSAFSCLAADGEDPTVNLTWLKVQLGVRHYGDRRMATYLRLLIDKRGFPAPLPCLRKAELTSDVTPDSLWIRRAVQEWLGDFLPPAVSAAIEADRLAAAAADMDAAAHNLRLIQGGKSDERKWA